jgi:hypothetical protein
VIRAYLVDAISTEAESRINEEMLLQVKLKLHIKVANYAEIHPFEMQIVGLNLKSFWPMMRKAEKNVKKYVFFLVQPMM